MLIKSKAKYIQSLSQKKQRDADGVFVAEGPKIINELLGCPNIQPQQLFATEEWISQHPHPGLPVTGISQIELERISFLQTPNQVTGIFNKPVFTGIDCRNKITLMLDGIQDPGNLGTIIRCADWFGTDLVICSHECADVFNPKVVQSTMGSIGRVQVIYEDLQAFLQRPSGIPVYAATLEGEDIRHLQPVKEAIILIGNESKGVQEGLLALCGRQITIANNGKAE